MTGGTRTGASDGHHRVAETKEKEKAMKTRSVLLITLGLGVLLSVGFLGCDTGTEEDAEEVYSTTESPLSPWDILSFDVQHGCDLPMGTRLCDFYCTTNATVPGLGTKLGMGCYRGECVPSGIPGRKSDVCQCYDKNNRPVWSCR